MGNFQKGSGGRRTSFFPASLPLYKKQLDRHVRMSRSSTPRLQRAVYSILHQVLKTGKENIIFTYEKGDEGFNSPRGESNPVYSSEKNISKSLVRQPVISFNRINFNELSNNIGNWRGEKGKKSCRIKREPLSFFRENEKWSKQTLLHNELSNKTPRFGGKHLDYFHAEITQKLLVFLL